ncbi:MAG: tetratricopeptide repeat protein [Planctomycetota bacterium]|nr:tetratricopeptide repeat protein [Planctomycetota bacterium]
MSACTKHQDADEAKSALHPKIRPSRVGKWRALVLVLLHVVFVAHLLHWKSNRETLTPVEPSEAMQFATEGVVNAGLIFFGITIVSTLILGRWFCGWACHVVALQDFCRYLLEKIGVRPRLVNMGLLRSVPWIAFTYMFLMPFVGRILEGAPLVATSVQLYTSDFWRTFPTWPVAVATFLVCGFAIVYFLGAKGFCNYGCPYGAIFGITDQLAPMRIRVTDACEGCGHCTAVCTSNVKVHQEVRDWKMVVDPACMKCLDCVSVCPKNALYVGFGAPAFVAKPRREPKSFAKNVVARWLVVAAFTVGAFWALSAFNGEVGAYANPADWRLIGTLSAASLIVMFVFRSKAAGKQEFSLVEEALLGVSFLAALLACRGLNGLVPLLFALGLSSLFAWSIVQLLRLTKRADVKLQHTILKSNGAWRSAGFVFAGAMVLVLSGFVFATREQLELRRSGRTAFAQVVFNQGVASAQSGDVESAIKRFRRALSFDPTSLEARENLAGMLCQVGRFREGVEQFEIALAQNPDDAETHALCARALLALNDSERALVHLAQALALAPDRADWRRIRADVLRSLGRHAEAAAELDLGPEPAPSPR